MKKNEKAAVIEAILFTMGDSVEIDRLAEVIEEDVDTTKGIIADMKKSYESSSRGIDIIELEDSVQLCTKADMYEYLIKIAKTPRKYVMTDSLLETLSIVAYKQPVTKQEIADIRGVQSDAVVNRLVEYNLITEKGRKKTPGRPVLFGTTDEFLRNFGIETIKDLPHLDPANQEQLEQLRLEQLNTEEEKEQ